MFPKEGKTSPPSTILCVGDSKDGGTYPYHVHACRALRGQGLLGPTCNFFNIAFKHCNKMKAFLLPTSPEGWRNGLPGCLNLLHLGCGFMTACSKRRKKEWYQCLVEEVGGLAHPKRPALKEERGRWHGTPLRACSCRSYCTVMPWNLLIQETKWRDHGHQRVGVWRVAEFPRTKCKVGVVCRRVESEGANSEYKDLLF